MEVGVKEYSWDVKDEVAGGERKVGEQLFSAKEVQTAGNPGFDSRLSGAARTREGRKKNSRSIKRRLSLPYPQPNNRSTHLEKGTLCYRGF
jgi:hypothetical protein